MFDKVKEIFADCDTPAATYEKLIALGRMLPPFPTDQITEENRVHGCQSQTHLICTLTDDKLHFQATSDALISAGLAALLLQAFNGQTPEFLLKTKPTFLEELNIPQSLTPNRASGLYSMHLTMQQHALKLLATKA